MAAAVLGSAFQENFSNGYLSTDEPDFQSITNGKPYQDFNEFRFPTTEDARPQLYNPQSPPKQYPPKQRSVTDPQTFIDAAKLEAKLSRPRATQRRKERAKVLSGFPIHTLVEKLVYEEFDAQESRRLLKDAMSRLDAAEKRATQAESDRRAIEMAQAVQGFKVMQNNQEELAKAKQDVRVYQYQLQNVHRDIERQRDEVRQLERQRDDAESAAQSARSIAREADSQRILAMMQADTQKRWLEENLRTITAASNRKRHHRSSSGSPQTEKTRQTIHDASGRQQNDFRQMLESYKRELMDSFRRESEQRESARQQEMQRIDDDRKLERDRTRQREQEIEHEKEEMRKRDKERSDTLQKEFDKLHEKERKFRREKSELQDREAELLRERDRAQDRVRQLEGEVQELKRLLKAEREKAASQQPPGTLPRVLMPRPPNPNLVPRLPSPVTRSPPAAEVVPPPAVPVVPPPGEVSQPQPTTGSMFPPQQVQPNPYRGRAGTGTPESGVSTITVQSARDILTFNDERNQRRDPNQPVPLQRQLSAISEVSDVPTASPSRASNSNASPSPGPAPPPSWFGNPPVDFLSKSQSIDQWRRSTSDAAATEPNSPDTPSGHFNPRRREGGSSWGANDPRRISQRSSGSFNINVEPPSAPASSSGGPETTEPERMGFLSPNSAHAALPKAPEPQPPQPQHTAPVIPSFSSGFGGPPPGFVMQSFTPASSNSGVIPPPPIIPSSPSTRPIFPPASPGQPVIPPPPVIPPSSSSTIYSWGDPPSTAQTPTPTTGSSWRSPSASSIYASGPAPTTIWGGEPASRQTPHMPPRSIYQPFPPTSGRQSVPAPGVASTSSSTGSAHTPRSSIYSSGPQPQQPQGILRRTGAGAPVIPPGPSEARTPSSIYQGLPQVTGTDPRQGFHGIEEDDGDDLDPVTRHNTNLNSRVDTTTPTPALPIPPPTFPRPPQAGASDSREICVDNLY